MKRKINYIETTLNGYIIKRIEICDYDSKTDYIDKLIFEDDGETINYYEDITGDHDLLDAFLKQGSNRNIGYESVISEQPHIFLDSWQTLTLGYYEDVFVGLEIK